jgi:hypothetical protein
MAKQTQQQEQFRDKQPQDRNRYQVRLGWFIGPLILLSLYAFLKSIAPVLSWDQCMDWLGVSGDRERFTMMTILMLVLILITAIWRILRR